MIRGYLSEFQVKICKPVSAGWNLETRKTAVKLDDWKIILDMIRQAIAAASHYKDLKKDWMT